MEIKNFIELESARDRFMSNEQLFKRFLYELPDRELYGDLKAALNEKNVEEAFEVAHKMKGVVGSLSLIPLADIVCRIVEELRVEKLPDDGLVRELDDAYEQTIKNIAYIQENNITIFG